MYQIIKWILPIMLALIVIGTFLLGIIPKKNSLEEKQNFCQTLQTNFKTFCEECSKKTTDKILIIKCMAGLIITSDQDAARKICFEIEEKSEAELCFAEALRRIDLNSSLTQCDLIEEIGRKAHCRALTFRDMGKKDEALSECERFLEINSTGAYNQCLALVLLNKTYCYEIEDEEGREYCLASVE